MTYPTTRDFRRNLTTLATRRGVRQGLVPIEWTPLELFQSGEQGVWYDPSDLTTLYQDAAGTVPVTSDGDPVGLITDKSGNLSNAVQTVSAARPTYSIGPSQIVFDKVDDNLSVDFTGSGGFTATLLQASKEGIFHAEVAIPDGVWEFTQNSAYFPSDNIIGMIVNEGQMSSVDTAKAKQYLINLGSLGDFSGTTAMDVWFRDRTDLLLLDVSNWDTSNVISFRSFVYGCSSLTTLDVSNWDTSNVNNFGYFAFGCSSLTTLIVNGGTGSPFSDSLCTTYTNAFLNTNLTQQSIDDILVAIELAGTINGTFGQSGGSAPSVTGEAAIDALRARGWTIAVTGGY